MRKKFKTLCAIEAGYHFEALQQEIRAIPPLKAANPSVRQRRQSEQIRLAKAAEDPPDLLKGECVVLLEHKGVRSSSHLLLRCSAGKWDANPKKISPTKLG
jgi:hypothetical protein